jgi:sec-independent protein translocase protein TatA
MGNLGATEILLILLVVVLLFGGRKIPELMKGLGQGMKEFKKASQYDPNEEDKKTRVPLLMVEAYILDYNFSHE